MPGLTSGLARPKIIDSRLGSLQRVRWELRTVHIHGWCHAMYLDPMIKTNNIRVLY